MLKSLYQSGLHSGWIYRHRLFADSVHVLTLAQISLLPHAGCDSQLHPGTAFVGPCMPIATLCHLVPQSGTEPVA